MGTVLVGAPVLHHAGSEDLKLANGVVIGQLPNVLWDESVLKPTMSHVEIKELSFHHAWLTVSKNLDDQHDTTLYPEALKAMYALQIIRPLGCKNLYLRFRQTPKGLDITGSFRPVEMKAPAIADMILQDHAEIKRDFEKVHQGV